MTIYLQILCQDYLKDKLFFEEIYEVSHKLVHNNIRGKTKNVMQKNNFFSFVRQHRVYLQNPCQTILKIIILSHFFAFTYGYDGDYT